MTVLTLAGKKINWLKPPSPTTRVVWSQKDIYGRAVTGSLRTIAHLDWLNQEAKRVFGRGMLVIQPPFNSTVRASAGTHDYDACLDVYIPGINWLTAQQFFRERGFACWVRWKNSVWNTHIHGFSLPPQEGSDRSDDWAMQGFKVGYLVDGGWSTRKRRVAHAQITSYYNHRSGMSGDARDTTWFPADIKATIFDLNQYIKTQRGTPTPAAPKPPVSRNRKTYVVKSGDSLSTIGARYDVTWQNIAKWSGVKDPNKISVGQVLYLEKP